MSAYKMFRKDMTCTMGKGVFQYEVGKTYTEPEATCRKNGFHCAENPLDCLDYYRDFESSVCCEVLAGGSVDEDDRDSKISCTEITILRKLSLEQFVVEAARYIISHPKMPTNRRVMNIPSPVWENHFVIVRCEKPAAKGEKGDVICCLRSVNGKITEAGVYTIDGETFRAGTWYGPDGNEVAMDAES